MKRLFQIFAFIISFLLGFVIYGHYFAITPPSFMNWAKAEPVIEAEQEAEPAPAPAPDPAEPPTPAVDYMEAIKTSRDRIAGLRAALLGELQKFRQSQYFRINQYRGIGGPPVSSHEVSTTQPETATWLRRSTLPELYKARDLQREILLEKERMEDHQHQLTESLRLPEP